MDLARLVLERGERPEAVKRVGRLKLFKGRLLQRSVSFYMDSTMRITYKLMVREDYEGEADDLIDTLEADVAGTYVQQRRYTQGRETSFAILLYQMGFQLVARSVRAEFRGVEGR